MRVIETGLPDTGAAFSWAVERDGIVYTAQVPIREGGEIETGAFGDQARLTLENLKATLRAAGIGPGDLTQVVIYLTDVANVEEMNEIYADFISPPYPNRATLIVSALAVPGMCVEILAHAHLPSESQEKSVPATSTTRGPGAAP